MKLKYKKEIWVKDSLGDEESFCGVVLGRDGDLGVDVRTPNGFSLAPQESACISTGISIEQPKVPEFLSEYFQVGCFVESKSGLSVKSNIEKGAGVIDPNYTGELIIKLYNHSEKRYAFFRKGDKICQLVFKLCAIIDEIEEVDEITENKDRGNKGFGSSGR